MYAVIRVLDLVFSLFGLVILAPVILVLILFGLFDTGSPLFVQRRVGKNRVCFDLYKLRTMHVDTKSAATHTVSHSSVTKYGSFLRKTKLDELPQLVNVIKGDMSLVGYRPCLPSQQELISFRESYHIHDYRPGITGLSQISNVDMSNPEKLSKLDAEMYREISLASYFYYIFLTVRGRGKGDNTII